MWSGESSGAPSHETGIHRRPAPQVAAQPCLPGLVWSRWVPPAEAPVRFETSCFVGAAPDQPVHVDGGEIVAWRWCTPRAALAGHAAGAMVVMPPTWITLNDLAGAESGDVVLASAPDVPPVYRTQIQRESGRTRLSWQEPPLSLDVSELPWRLSHRDAATRPRPERSRTA